MTLSPEQIASLLAKREFKSKPNAVDGPARIYDKEHRCATKGCSSPTYYKIEGVPRCSAHALIILNDLVIEAQDNMNARRGQFAFGDIIE